MGTEVTEEDLTTIHTLAERVIELTEYRGSLAEYWKLRRSAIAPNLTYMEVSRASHLPGWIL